MTGDSLGLGLTLLVVSSLGAVGLLGWAGFCFARWYRADAETRVMMARRFYNDAVRDTRSLADRFLVRLLRLGGRAQRPEYFEIVERVTPGTAD